MDLLRQLQSRIDRRSNFLAETEYDHKIDKCYQEELKIMREEQTLDKRLYGELLRKMEWNKRILNDLYNLEDKLYGKEYM